MNENPGYNKLKKKTTKWPVKEEEEV